METKLANPAPLGLIGFAATTWLLSMINAGLFGKESIPLVLGMALAFGGAAQILASAIIALFTIVNCLGIRRTARIQNVLTSLKVLIILTFLIMVLVLAFRPTGILGRRAT